MLRCRSDIARGRPHRSRLLWVLVTPPCRCQNAVSDRQHRGQRRPSEVDSGRRRMSRPGSPFYLSTCPVRVPGREGCPVRVLLSYLPGREGCPVRVLLSYLSTSEHRDSEDAVAAAAPPSGQQTAALPHGSANPPSPVQRSGPSQAQHPPPLSQPRSVTVSSDDEPRYGAGPGGHGLEGVSRPPSTPSSSESSETSSESSEMSHGLEGVEQRYGAGPGGHGLGGVDSEVVSRPPSRPGAG
jgi:hypothetical protein